MHLFYLMYVATTAKKLGIIQQNSVNSFNNEAYSIIRLVLGFFNLCNFIIALNTKFYNCNCCTQQKN